MVQHHKASYTFNPDFYWIHDCWLCSKHFEDNCLACPLGKCAGGSLYGEVTKYFYSKVKQAKALECAKKILNVILAEKEAEMKIIKKGRKYYKKREHDVDDTLCFILVVITLIFVLVRIMI